MSDNPYDSIVSAATAPKPSSYDDIIERHATANGIDSNLVRAVMGQESSGNRTAVSPKGARGLMQLMPATAARFGVTNPNDPEQNIAGGTKYLKYLSDRYNGDVDKTLAAYNAGEGNVDKYGGIPPFKETQNYVPSVKARYAKLSGQQKPVTNPYGSIVQAATAPDPQAPTVKAAEADVESKRQVQANVEARKQAATPNPYDSIVAAATPQASGRGAAMARAQGSRQPVTQGARPKSVITGDPSFTAGVRGAREALPTDAVIPRLGQVPASTRAFLNQEGQQPMAQDLRSQIARQVEDEYGSMAGQFQVPLTDPIGAITKSRERMFNEEVDRRVAAAQRANTPEMVVARKELGATPAVVRGPVAAANKFGGSAIRSLSGLTSVLGIAPNKLSDFLEHRAQVLTEGSDAPLNEQGELIKRSLPEKASEAVTSLGLTVAQLVLLKKATGLGLGNIMAAETALQTSKMPMRDRAAEILKSKGMGEILDQHLSRPLSAVLFGAPTAIQSGLGVAQGTMSLEDALLHTIVQTGAGAALGGKPKAEPVAESSTVVPDIDTQLAAREAAVKPVTDAQGNVLLNADEIAQNPNARPKIRLAQRGTNENSPNAVSGTRGYEPASPVVESRSDQASNLRGGLQDNSPNITSPEPVRHVDLQPRTPEGQFDQETPAQAEARREQVAQSQPASNVRSMLVNGEQVTAELTPENAAKFDQIDADLKHQNESSLLFQDPNVRKGRAMRAAAEKRALHPDFATGIEQAAAAKRETTNYVGKEVTVGGQDAIIAGSSFGRVKVKLGDGSTRMVDAADITAKPKVDARIPVSTPQPDLSTQAQPAIPDTANVTPQGAAGVASVTEVPPRPRGVVQAELDAATQRALDLNEQIRKAERIALASDPAIRKIQEESLARNKAEANSIRFKISSLQGELEPVTQRSEVSVPEPQSAASEVAPVSEAAKGLIYPALTREVADAKLKRAGSIIDGLKVRDYTPNESSINGSANDYDVLPGIREVPMSAFETPGDRNAKRGKILAEEIKSSGEINPLIVVIDEQGPYILEGSNRYDALTTMGAKSFPAKVVIDNDVPTESSPAIAKTVGQPSEQVIATRETGSLRQAAETNRNQNVRSGPNQGQSVKDASFPLGQKDRTQPAPPVPEGKGIEKAKEGASDIADRSLSGIRDAANGPTAQSRTPTPAPNIITEEPSKGGTGATKELSFPKTLKSTGRETGNARVYQEFTDKESQDRADARIAKDREAARNYVLQTNDAPETSAGKERIATGLKLADQLAGEAEKSKDPTDAATKHGQAIELYDKLSTDLLEAGQTVQAASQARKYSLSGAPLEVVRIAKRNGNVPKASDISDVRDMAKRQDDLETRLADVQKQIETMQANGKKVATVPRAKVETLTDRLARMESDARARLDARTKLAQSQTVGSRGERGAGINPVDVAASIADWTTIGAAKIARGGLNFAAWSKEMIGEFGEAIKPHLNKIFLAAHKLASEQRATLKEESTQRSATKTGMTLDDFKQQRYELQTQKRQARLDMDRKFNELDRRAQRGPIKKVSDAVGSVLTNSLLSYHGLLNILSTMTAKEAINTALRVPEAGLDFAERGIARTFGKQIPRASAGLSPRQLGRAVKTTVTEGPRNIAKAFLGRPSEVMPRVHEGATDSAKLNLVLDFMSRHYAAKEALVRTPTYNLERSNQASIMAHNDITDGIIKRSQLNQRIDDYLNGRASLDGPLNKQYAASLADQAADYEIKSRNPTTSGIVTPSAKAARVKEMMTNPTQLIDSQALQYADKEVYANPLGPRMQKIQDALNAGGPIPKALIQPFFKRPVNAFNDLLYGYTGAKAVKEGGQAALNALRGQEWTPAERQSFNRAVARGGTVYGLAALGYALAGRGLITSGNDKDHPGCLVVGNSYWNIGNKPVIGWAVVAGATARIDGMNAVPRAVGRMVLDHPLLKGLKNVTDAAQEGYQATQGNFAKLSKAATGFASKTLGRVIPTPIAATAETMDTQSRDTKGLTGPLKARIPLVRQQLPPTGPKERGSAFDPFLAQPIRLKPRGAALKF